MAQCETITVGVAVDGKSTGDTLIKTLDQDMILDLIAVRPAGIAGAGVVVGGGVAPFISFGITSPAYDDLFFDTRTLGLAPNIGFIFKAQFAGMILVNGSSIFAKVNTASTYTGCALLVDILGYKT